MFASCQLVSLTQQPIHIAAVRCKIYGDAGKWDYVAEVANTLCTMLPDSAFGPLHLAHALRKLDRSTEARDALLPVADKFPEDWRIAFQKAYCCKAGELKAVMLWLGRAIDVAGKVDVRTRALDEPDLEPLWRDISEI